MIARVLIWGLLIFVVLRAIFRFLGGVIEGGSSRPSPTPQRKPEKGEMMVRDPVCGTFVVPSRSLSVRDRQGSHYFCSDKCRQDFLAR